MSKSLAGLLVCAAVGWLAPAARAEFSMQIVDNETGDGFKIQENATHTAFTLQTFGKVLVSDWSPSAGAIKATATIDGYTFNVSSLSNQDKTSSATMGGVSLNGTVTTNAGAAPTSFSFYASDNPFTFPGTSGSTLHLKAQAFTQNWNTGDYVQAQTQYTAYGPGTPVEQYLTGMAGPLSGPNQSAQTNVVTIPSRGTQYAVSVLGGMAMNGHPGTSSFWVQSATAMPEPTGIVIGLLGVPCLGGLIFLSRRAAKVSAVA
jgi:hypothetical protein